MRPRLAARRKRPASSGEKPERARHLFRILGRRCYDIRPLFRPSSLSFSLPARADAVQPSQVRTGALPRNADALLLVENGTNLTPLLKPEVFRRLSAAGQRAVSAPPGCCLRRPANGLARPPLARTARRLDAGRRTERPRERPSADVDGHTQQRDLDRRPRQRHLRGLPGCERGERPAYGISTDGGSTFQQRSLPAFPGGENLGDPVVAFGPNGEIYYSTLAIAGDGVSFIALCVFDGQRRHLGCGDASALAANIYDTQDKSWIAVDTSTSKYRGDGLRRLDGRVVRYYGGVVHPLRTPPTAARRSPARRRSRRSTESPSCRTAPSRSARAAKSGSRTSTATSAVPASP